MNPRRPTLLERGAPGRALWALLGVLLIWAAVAWALS